MARQRKDGAAAWQDGTAAWDLMAVGSVVAKLAGHLDWPWWLILAPVWMQLAIMPYVSLCAISKYAEILKETMDLRRFPKYTGCLGGLDLMVRLFLRLMRPHGPRPRRVIELFAAYVVTSVVGLVSVTFVVLALEGVLSSLVFAVGVSTSLLGGGMMARSIGAEVTEDNTETAITTDSSGTEEVQPH